MSIQAGPSLDAAQRSSPRPYIAALDGFRGLAVLLVVIFHAGIVSFSGRGRLVQVIGNVRLAGWIGVDLFFVLSGFLITGILLSTVHEPHYFRNFYVRRMLRIFPLYYGVLAALMIATPLLRFDWQGSLPYYLLYIQNFHARPVLMAAFTSVRIDHFWSLAIEEQFYFVWPFLLFLFRGGRGVLFVPLAFMIICPVARMIALRAGMDTANLYFWTPFRSDALGWGGFAAIAFRQFDPHRTALIRRVCLILGGVLCLAVLVYLRGALDNFAPIMAKVFYSSLDMFCCGVILTIVQQGHWLARVFSVSVLRWFGLYSFGIYVFHLIVLDPCEQLRDVVNRITGSRPLGAAALVVSNVVLSSIVAYLSFHLYEERFLRLKDRLAGYDRAPSSKIEIDARQEGALGRVELLESVGNDAT